MKNKLIDEQTSRIQEFDKMMGEQLVRLQKSADELLSQEAYIHRLMLKFIHARDKNEAVYITIE